MIIQAWKPTLRRSTEEMVVAHNRATGSSYIPTPSASRPEPGLILEVIGSPGHERYRVRWDEEHESIYYPGSDATIEKQPPL